MLYLDRRQSLLLAAGALLTVSREASAQSKVPSYKDIVDRAQSVQTTAIAVEKDKDIIVYIEQDYYARKYTVLAAEQTSNFRNAAIAESYITTEIKNNSIRFQFSTESQAVSSQVEAINFVVKNGAPIVPALSDIHPIGIPSIAPVENKNADTDLGVALDIALQTIGIFEGKTLVDELLRDEDVSNGLSALIPAIKSKDWAKILEFSEKLFRIVVASKFFLQYAEKAGAKIAFKLSVRCVPIVGWLYMAASFLVAVKENYNRFSFV